MYRRAVMRRATTKPAGRAEKPGGYALPGSKTASGDTWFGVPENSTEYAFIPKVGTHSFAVAPILRTKSDVAHNQIKTLCDSMNPQITVEMIERARSRMTGMDRKEREKMMASFMMIYFERLCNHFKGDEHKLDYAVVEKMFFPKYLPRYAEVRDAFQLPRRLWYTPETYTTLENISRIPLERCDEHGRMTLDFEEWYSLFFNFHQNFHPIAFLAELSQATVLYTKEYVDGLAQYLADRCKDLGDTTSPILDCHTLCGRLAHLLNATKIIPVPVVAIHELPKPNVYLLHIPKQFQKEFDLQKVERSTLRDALQKYRPSIVICQDMPADTDWTREFRAEGSVKEYLLLGIPNSALSGHMWYTWGWPSFRPEDDPSKIPHHMASGFVAAQVNHLSRYMYHKSDSHLAYGFAQTISFHKVAFTWSSWQRLSWFTKRLRTFY